MKRNTVKRLLAFMLAAAMCISLIACGQKEVEVAPEASQDATPGATNEVAPEVVNYWDMLNEVSDTSELPDWTGDTLEVNVWIAGGTEAAIGDIAETNVTFKELERVTGVKFNFEESYGNNGETIDAVLPRIITSGDLPNIIAGWNIGQQLRELYDNGYLADLTDYYANGDLDQVTYWADMEDFDSILYADARTEDGNYYLIPQHQKSMNYFGSIDPGVKEYDAEYYNMYGATPTNASGLMYTNILYVRDDILKAVFPDALTMDEIKQIYVENGTFTEDEIYDVELNSAEDFFKLLEKIKELTGSGEYVSLSGQPVEVTYGPHSETDNWNWMYYLPQTVNGFASETDYFVAFDRNAKDESSVLVRAVDMPEYKSWMQELNTLVNADIISQNSLVDNSATFNEKLTNGHYAVIYGDTASVRAYDINGSEAGWSYRPVWVNTPVNQNFGGISTGSSESYYGIFKDTLTDDQLDQLIHAINYLYSAVGTNNFYWGPASAGLFTEDADGNRSYTDPELEANVLGGVDNGAALKYGIYGSYGAENTFSNYPKSVTAIKLLSPSYMTASQRDRSGDDAKVYYTPAILPGLSRAENVDIFSKDSHAYSFGMRCEGIKEFWSARAGFEDQMKKVMAATPDKFEAAYAELISFCEQNSLTAESVKEFNDLFVEFNLAQLQDLGIVN